MLGSGCCDEQLPVLYYRFGGILTGAHAASICYNDKPVRPRSCCPLPGVAMRRLRLWWSRSPEAVAAGTRTSIANRLRWSYLLSSILPLMLVGALLVKINPYAQQSRIYSDQRGLASRVARDISRYINDLRAQLDLGMRPNASLDQSVEPLTSAALSLAVSNAPNLIEIAVLDDAGKELLRINRLLKIPPEQLRDLSGDPGVQRAIQDGVSTHTPIDSNAD